MTIDKLQQRTTVNIQEKANHCRMRILYIIVIVLLNKPNITAQSVYMHEAQEEFEGYNFFDALPEFVIFVGIIWIINKIIDNYNRKKKAKREYEWEIEVKKRIEEERIRESEKKIAKDKFVQTLICKNTIEIGGFFAVDLGLGDKLGNPMFATKNLGASNQFENGGIYGWGMNRPAKRQELSFNMEPCPIKLKTLEELEIISGGYGSYKGNFEFDAASKEMNGLWFTPDNDEINELLSKCDWLFIDKFDITGWKVTGPNGNFIFIPVDKKNEHHVLLTSLASLNENKETTTEYGRTKFAQFLEIYGKYNREQVYKIIELDRLRVGHIRPVTYGEDNWPGSVITEYNG